MCTRVCLTLLLFFVAGLSGCGSAATAARKSVFPASGTIKLNGAPLSDAVVTFAPTEGQPTAFGTTNADGKFTLTTYDLNDGAAAGNFKVVVTKTAEEGSASGSGEGGDHEAEAEAANKAHDAKGSDESLSLVPNAFSSFDTTTLTAEVKSTGENSFTLELK